MSDPRRISPLDHRKTQITPDQSVRIEERPFSSKHILRVKTADVAKTTIKLPAAKLVLRSDETQILWLGPDEWMLVTPTNEQSQANEALSNTLSGLHHQIVDVSDYYTIIRLSGEKCVELLMKLSTLDLHPRQFKSGTVAGSVFGKANAWLMKSDDDGEEVFDLLVRWSMADYLWCLLAEAGREFGIEAQVPIGQEKGLRYKKG